MPRTAKPLATLSVASSWMTSPWTSWRPEDILLSFSCIPQVFDKPEGRGEAYITHGLTKSYGAGWLRATKSNLGVRNIPNGA